MQDGNMGAGKQFALLVRVAIHRVVDEVAAYPAVVQQGVALARRPIADDGFSFPFGADQELQKLALGLLHLLSEVAIGFDAVKPSLIFALSHFDNTRTDRKSTRLNSSHLGISYAVFC